MTAKGGTATVEDFGEQWTKFPRNEGFYASPEVLASLAGPLLSPAELSGMRIADVGAGTGRYTRMFHQLGAESVLAVEPSAAVEALRANTKDLGGVEVLQATADALPPLGFDFVFCIGVLQFIPDPGPSLRAMGRALGPGGRMFLWVYGEENNGAYLRLVRPLRKVTRRLPHAVLTGLCSTLLVPADAYAWLCRRWRLPMSEYMRGYFSKLNRYSRRLVLYDQLNPGYARYYRKEELEALLASNGFTDIRFHHRFGTSWSMTARFAAEPSSDVELAH